MPYYDPSASPTYDPTTTAGANATIAGDPSKGLKPGEVAPGIMGNWAMGPDGKPKFVDPTLAGWANQDEDVNKGLLASYYGQMGDRTAPMSNASATMTDGAYAGTGATYGGATIDTSASDAARGYQMGLLNQLQGEAAGTAPSIAAMQMQQGLQQNLQQQASLAGSLGGSGNPALAMRNLQYGAAAQNQQLLGQTGLARLQEQQMAQQQLGNVAGAMRGQDLSSAMQQAQLNEQTGLFNAGAQNQFSLANAGFEQQANLSNQSAQNQFGLQQSLANQQAQLGLMGMTQQGQQWALGQNIGMSEAERQARLQWEQMQAQQRQFGAELGWQQDQANAAWNHQMLGAGLSAGANIAYKASTSGDSSGSGSTSSDYRAKTDIANASTLSSVDTKTGIVDESSAGDSPYETPAQVAKSGTFADKMNAIRQSGIGGGAPADPGSSTGSDFAKGAMTLGMMGLMMSDEHEKEGVHLGASGQLLDPLTPYSYRYKDPTMPGASPGRHLGVMAQDLERSPAGAEAVTDTPNGKMVDYHKLAPPMLAAEADMHKRLSVVEQMLGVGKSGAKATKKGGK